MAATSTTLDLEFLQGITWGPRLTHLFFADDSLFFFGKATLKLRSKVNQNNTVIFFSKSTSKTTRQIIKGILGVQEIKHYEKYFSLPSLMGKGKKVSFNYIKERVWRKQSG
ncbi:hypothetical protein RGQ29_018514 [Quercus rubra]|uniref:Reverse transcriptase domain-containing protein n=1 Tax=Quercus rubra TaxID=3512 RepID=A0AAN7J1Y7_QUERU|nr:hypothetical protein RGQ29_018514 [Quercus rubra]